MPIPIVSIVGCPNVGKSTFFNRLTQTHHAVVAPEAGVTRDRSYGTCHWNGARMLLIDTGGYLQNKKDPFQAAIQQQIGEALKESHLILFLVDCKTERTAGDRVLAEVVRKTEKKVIIVANKADNALLAHGVHSFHSLGISKKIFPVSSLSGYGTGDLLDEVVAQLPETPPAAHEEETLPRIAILGRPNVGKSSLLNAWLREERSIVSPTAGTTRDAIDTLYTAYGKRLWLTDTAGIRKKNKITGDVEFYSVVRSIRAMQQADVCVVMIEATSGLDAQDMHILQQAHAFSKGIVLMVNKWDLVEKNTHTAQEASALLKKKLGDLSYCPLLFASVREKQRIYQVLETALAVHEQRKKRIRTSVLNETMGEEIRKTPPATVKRRQVKIKYITQVPGLGFPKFLFFCNLPEHVRPSYERFLKNKLREHFDFSGVPIKVQCRRK